MQSLQIRTDTWKGGDPPLKLLKKLIRLGAGGIKNISEGAMRIVCPRCVAQYEVDETAIPETGREVQCANCENIWFQDFIEMLPDRPAETAAEPEETGVFDEKEVYPYLTEGIGEDILPENVNFDVIDTFVKVTDKDAALMTRRLAKEEGIFGGISTGASLYGAIELAKRPENRDKNIITLFPSGGERYLSTPLWDVDDL